MSTRERTSDDGPEGSDALDAAQRGVEHVLGIYDTDAFLVRTVVDFVRAALESGGMVMVILGSTHQSGVREGLRAADIDVDAAIAQGDLVEASSDAVLVELTEGGSFDAEAYRDMAQTLVATAEARGRALHICGNLHSALWERGEIDVLLGLEGAWNRTTASPALHLLCLYDSRVFDRTAGHDALPALCREHLRLRPVEDLASLVGSDDRRSIALLEVQRQADEVEQPRMDAQRERLAAALDRCLLGSRRELDHFERAVASRDLVGQATGIVMARWHLDADTAFAELRAASDRSRRRLHDVAAAVVHQQRRLADER